MLLFYQTLSIQIPTIYYFYSAIAVFYIHLGYSSNDIVFIQLSPIPGGEGDTSARQGIVGKHRSAGS